MKCLSARHSHPLVHFFSCVCRPTLPWQTLLRKPTALFNTMLLVLLPLLTAAISTNKNAHECLHLRLTRSILLNCTMLYDTYCIELASYCLSSLLCSQLLCNLWATHSVHMSILYNALYNKSFVPCLLAIYHCYRFISVIAIMCNNVKRTSIPYSYHCYGY